MALRSVIFSDSFESGTQLDTGNPDWTLSSDYGRNGSIGYGRGSDSSHSIRTYTGQTFSAGEDFHYEGWVRLDGPNLNIAGLTFGNVPGGGFQGYQAFIYSDGVYPTQIQLRKYTTGFTLLDSDYAAFYSPGQWYRIVVTWRAIGVRIIVKFYTAGGTLIGTLNSNDITYTSGHVGVQAYNGASIDDLSLYSTVKYENGYEYRKKISVNSGQVAGVQTNFPVLVKVTDPDLRRYYYDGKVHLSGFQDIRFEDMNGNKLAYEIDKYVQTTGELAAWVKFPSLSDSTEIYVYYGKDTCDNEYEGITLGVSNTDLVLERNVWNGSPNIGEIAINGSSLIGFDGANMTINPLNSGVALSETLTDPVEGFIMWSQESVHTRFSGTSLNPGNADHFIGVIYDNGWKYDDNSNNFVSFTPEPSDVLIVRAKWGKNGVATEKLSLIVGEEDAGVVWDDYNAVYHMKDEPDGTSLDVKDSSPRALHATSQGTMTSADSVAGKINKALDLEGTDDSILTPSSTYLDLTNDLTLSIWFKPHTAGARRDLIYKTYGGEFEITYETNGICRFYWGTSGDDAVPYQGVSGSTVLTLNEWNHVLVSRKLGAGGWVRLWVNGNRDASEIPDFSSATVSVVQASIGAGRLSNIDGEISEARFLPVARDDSWVEAEYTNQNNPSAFYTFGDEELPIGANTGAFLQFF